MKKVNRQRGATTGLVAVLSLVLVMLSLAFFQLLLYFGGADETRNATDAGALGVGQEALKTATKAESSAEHQFDDVADANGNFSLTNINRVWGKALLANLNANAMNQQGFGSSSANQNAKQLFDAAKSISDRLTRLLSNKENHFQAFEQLSTQNAANMMGANARVAAARDKQWRTSLVDRESESNISFDPDQLPSGGDLALLSPVSGKDGNRYVPGYKPIKVMENVFLLVPFPLGEKPHLISASEFEGNTREAKPLPDQANPVPNAFSAQGKTVNQAGHGQLATAFAQTNPQRAFDMLMPHAFVRIKLLANKARFIHNLIPMTQSTYDFSPEQQQLTFPAGTGTAIVTANLGNEYIPPTLHQAIYAFPTCDYSAVTKSLLQRCREIKKDITEAELKALLQMPIERGVNEYLIFPINKQTLVVAPNVAALALAKWINIRALPDGRGQEIASESSGPDNPNKASVTLVGAGVVTVPPMAITVEHGSLKWTPGSGYDGCLGELEIERTTEVTSAGSMGPGTP